MDQKEIRVVICHANRLYRESLACILAQQHGIMVVRADAQLPQTNGELTALRPDLFVLDFGSSNRAGLNDARRIRIVSSQFKILLIDVPSTDAEVLACIECGASGYLLQDASLEKLVSNVRAVSSGETICSPHIAGLVFSRLSKFAMHDKQQGGVDISHLTKREIEIAILIEHGLSNKEIASHLNIEVATVKNHIHNILDKLQVNGRRQVAICIKEQPTALSV